MSGERTAEQIITDAVKAYGGKKNAPDLTAIIRRRILGFRVGVTFMVAGACLLVGIWAGRESAYPLPTTTIVTASLLTLSYMIMREIRVFSGDRLTWKEKRLTRMHQIWFIMDDEKVDASAAAFRLDETILRNKAERKAARKRRLGASRLKRKRDRQKKQ